MQVAEHVVGLADWIEDNISIYYLRNSSSADIEKSVYKLFFA